MDLENIKIRAKVLLNEGIPNQIVALQKVVSELKTLKSVNSPLYWNDVDLDELNFTLNKTLSSMTSFYYPLLLYISLLRPPIQAVESFQVHVQKEAISILSDCDANIKYVINNTSEYFYARGKSIKRLKRNPDNTSYAHALHYIGFQRVYAVMSAFEDLIHNLIMVQDFFKKNLIIIEEDNTNNNTNCFH